MLRYSRSKTREMSSQILMSTWVGTCMYYPTQNCLLIWKVDDFPEGNCVKLYRNASYPYLEPKTKSASDSNNEFRWTHPKYYRGRIQRCDVSNKKMYLTIDYQMWSGRAEGIFDTIGSNTYHSAGITTCNASQTKRGCFSFRIKFDLTAISPVSTRFLTVWMIRQVPTYVFLAEWISVHRTLEFDTIFLVGCHVSWYRLDSEKEKGRPS